MREVVDAAQRLDDERTDVGAIIITGDGSKAFAAGADIKELVDLTYAEVCNELHRSALMLVSSSPHTCCHTGGMWHRGVVPHHLSLAHWSNLNLSAFQAYPVYCHPPNRLQLQVSFDTFEKRLCYQGALRH